MEEFVEHIGHCVEGGLFPLDGGDVHIQKNTGLDMINSDSPASVSDSGTKAIAAPKKPGRPGRQPKAAKAGAVGKTRGRPRANDGLKEV